MDEKKKADDTKKTEQETPIGLKASLDGCAQAFDAEQSRTYDDEEACNDGVN